MDFTNKIWLLVRRNRPFTLLFCVTNNKAWIISCCEETDYLHQNYIIDKLKETSTDSTFTGKKTTGLYNIIYDKSIFRVQLPFCRPPLNSKMFLYLEFFSSGMRILYISIAWLLRSYMHWTGSDMRGSGIPINLKFLSNSC